MKTHFAEDNNDEAKKSRTNRNTIQVQGRKKKQVKLRKHSTNEQRGKAETERSTKKIEKQQSGEAKRHKSRKPKSRKPKSREARKPKSRKETEKAEKWQSRSVRERNNPKMQLFLKFKKTLQKPYALPITAPLLCP